VINQFVHSDAENDAAREQPARRALANTDAVFVKEGHPFLRTAQRVVPAVGLFPVPDRTVELPPYFPAAWASSASHVARRFGSASSLRFTATGPFDRRSALSDNTQLTGRSRRPNLWATLPIVYPCSVRQKCELPREKKPRS
jgi:hypothetical protein